MNVYFLVEGKHTERKLYPLWLSYAVPQLKRVNSPADASENSYYLVSAEGYPSIIGKILTDSIQDIEDTKKFDVFVVVLDADERSVQERINEVTHAVEQSKIKLQSARLEVIVQNRCIETWLLGNRKIFIRQPQDDKLNQFIAHYDIALYDPELMPLFSGFNSHGQFHKEYVKSIFKERSISYAPHNPGQAGEQSYFEQLQKRVDETNHIQSFARFLQLCERFANRQALP